MSKYAVTMKRTAWEVIPPGNYTLELIDVRDGPVFQNRAGQDEPTIKLVLTGGPGPPEGDGGLAP